ncbi:aldehyde dehydrogenase family protein [Aminipila terrae]|uniref:Aldehyde dehydrogenase family protein n=2 Tax=Aminipila terrae TaxID=2697030 RepID=A0A6P1MJ34_9FIRM|nr:aldehyde dehydrogenase family protein [Aminipila terrae]
MFINGQWVLSSSEKTRDIINPATGEIIAVVTEGKDNDAILAIESAKAAFKDDSVWRNMSAEERGALLYRIADLIEENIDEMARTESINTGKLFRETRYDDVYAAVGAFRYYGGIATSLQGHTANHSKDLLAMTIREPIGICSIIVPWNYPLGTAAASIAPALAAGNTIIVKPASLTPLTTIMLFEIFEEAGLPEGVANLVLGSGSNIGKELIANKNVNKIVFTGSTKTGMDIIRDSSSSLKKLALELGGKSPVIVFDDSDIDVVADNVMFGIFLSQGQLCVAGSRLLVQEDIYHKFVENLVKRVGSIKVGMPFDENAEFGPLISKEHMHYVLNYIEAGIKEGAKLAVGGKRITDGDFGNGYFVEPTVFIDCKNHMRIVQEEIFGPVLTVQSFSTEEEAINMANDTIYGLAGAVFTKDIEKALRVCKSVKSGILWVNTYLEAGSSLPVTPYKQSGIGVVGGVQGLEEFTVLKQINMSLNPKKTNWFSE